MRRRDVFGLPLFGLLGGGREEVGRFATATLKAMEPARWTTPFYFSTPKLASYSFSSREEKGGFDHVILLDPNLNVRDAG